MALPICLKCARSNILCAACESKLASGAINVYDVETSRALAEMLADEADFAHAIDTEDQVMIVAKDVGKVIGKGGANIRALSERIGKKVKVIGQDSLIEMATAIIAPARISGINTLLRPGGAKAYRIRVEIADRGRLRMGVEDIRRLINAASDCEVEIEFG
ncbi:MAG: KH domain-containing protein [Candidatus Altiarchaeota archaeon]